MAPGSERAAGHTPQGPSPGLLAVDVGLRTGLALFRRPATLEWYRSVHWPDRGRMRRGVWGVLRELRHLEWVALEGGGPLARIWHRASAKRGLRSLEAPAEAWRSQVLWLRERRNGPAAKRHALRLARRAIHWAGGPRPVSLTHDVAEAVLFGCWALWQVGWLDTPPDLRRSGPQRVFPWPRNAGSS